MSGLGGNDTLYGHGGNDTIDGGSGTDTAVYFGGWANYTISGSGILTITDTRGGSPDGTDTVSNVETFKFSNGTFTAAQIVNDAPAGIMLSASTIAEHAANNTVIGALAAIDADALLGDTATFTLLDNAGGRFAISGTNLIVAEGHLLDFETARSHRVTVRVTDTHGLAFDEVLTVSVGNVSPETLMGTAGANLLNGGSDRDLVFGLAGNDTINGNGGDDVLTGGTGRDILTGGASHDVFDFNVISETGKTAATHDKITDFTHLADHIDLSTIDASTKSSGNQNFKFISTANFHKKAGELHYLKQNPAGIANDKTIVEGDVNGDGKADFQIELTGLKSLAKGDFIL